MPIRPVSNPAPTTPSPVRSTQPHLRTTTLRAYGTRAAVVATTTAAAALLSVLPATGAAPASIAPSALGAAAAPVVSTPVIPVHVVAPAAVSSGRATAVQMALGKVGSPYRWGATGPSSFDCSGLVQWSFAQAGITVPRTSRAQSQSGTPVARADLQPGDLVFSYSPVSHVGIYIGDGKIVHSSRAGKPVAVADMAGRPFHSARRY